MLSQQHDLHVRVSNAGQIQTDMFHRIRHFVRYKKEDGHTTVLLLFIEKMPTARD